MVIDLSGVAEDVGCNDRCDEKMNNSFTLEFNTYGTNHCTWRYSDYLTVEGELEELAITLQIGHYPSISKYYIWVEVRLTTYVCDRSYSHQWETIYDAEVDCINLVNQEIDFDYVFSDEGGCDCLASTLKVSAG